MVNVRKVAKAAKNIALVPARLVDGVALNFTADASKYVLVHGAPWAWNRIPARLKTAAAHHLLDQNSKTRQTLDGLVTVAAGLAVVDKVAGPEVALYREIFEFYANNRLLSAGLTVGIPAAAAAGYDFVKPHVSKISRIAYGAALATGVTLLIALIASPFIGHPVGSKGVSGPEKPAAVEQKPLTQQDLEAYVANTLLPQVQQGMDKMSEEQKKVLQDYVNKFVEGYVAQRIAAGGYVTGNDLERLGEQISGQLSSLESRIKAAQATPTPTVVPPKPGQLEQYIQSTGYVVPAGVLRAAATANLNGLAAALSLPVETLTAFTDGSDANGEFVRLVVTGSGVTARANYGASVGQRDVPLQKTGPRELNVYLQNNLTPVQLNAITPVE